MADNYYDPSMFKESLIEEMKLSSAIHRRILFLSEDVTESAIFKLNYHLDRLTRLDKKEGTQEPITIMVSSFGGSVYEILSSVSRIESMKEQGYIIKTIIDAKAMSCGSLLSQTGTKGYRFAHRYSTILYHQVSSGTYGTLANMETDLDETKRLWALMKEITLKHTDVTDEWFEDLRKYNRDVYLTPIQCKELGIIDEII